MNLQVLQRVKSEEDNNVLCVTDDAKVNRTSVAVMWTPIVEHRTYVVSDVDTPRLTSSQEEPLKEPLSKQLNIDAPESVEILPDWYSDLLSIRGFTWSLPHCQAWLTVKGFAESKANQTAAAVKGAWPGNPKKPYTDAWAVFRNWIQRPEPSAPKNGKTQEFNKEYYQKEYDRLEARKRGGPR
jgi:hypothetical protein